jgi:hypothetical protein
MLTDLSGDMALRIEKAIGVKMDTLMRMQASYDIAQTRKREKTIHVRRITQTAPLHPWGIRQVLFQMYSCTVSAETRKPEGISAPCSFPHVQILWPGADRLFVGLLKGRWEDSSCTPQTTSQDFNSLKLKSLGCYCVILHTIVISGI